MPNPNILELVYKNKKVIVQAIQKKAGPVITQSVLREAALQTQALLRRGNLLPSKSGLKMFFDTESEPAKAAKKWRSKPYTDRHLIHMFNVDYEVTGDNSGNLIISNDKLVKGFNQNWSLFQLLWEGTDTYVQPVTLTPEQSARVAWTEKTSSQWTKGRYKRGSQDWAPSMIKRQKYPLPKMPENLQPARVKTEEEKWQSAHKNAVESAKNPRLNSRSVNEEGESVSADLGYRKTITATQTTTQSIRDQALAAIARFAGRFKSRGKMRDRTIGVYGEMEWVEDVTPDNIPAANAPKFMAYYNRYHGKFYYNQVIRKGINKTVVESFRGYIGLCVQQGLAIAEGRAESNKGTKILKEFGKLRFLKK